MVIRIEKAGILDTLQDLGRTGSRSSGVNTGGAMDPAAVRILNTLLGNDENAPVLEFHFPAPAIEFLERTTFAIGGARFGPHIDEKPVPNWSVLTADAGSRLRFIGPPHGMRTYISVRGGFAAEFWLGSASTNLFVAKGGFGGRPLRAGDTLELASANKKGGPPGGISAGRSIIPEYTGSLRVTEGPEHHLLTAEGGNTLLTAVYEASSHSDRMGLRLKGPAVGLLDDRQLVSSPVAQGTVQLLPDGNPLILGADCQTAGGYPRVLTVITADLPKLAQLTPGDRVSFRLVESSESLRSLKRFEKDLSFLRMGIRFRSL